MSKQRIGYWLPPQKKKSLDKFFQLVREQPSIELVEIISEKTVEEQGPFNLILQKGDNKEVASQIQAYSTKHPDVVILDPPKSIALIADRNSMFSSLGIALANFQGVRNPQFLFIEKHQPSEVQYAAWLQQNNLSFPLICKPFTSEGVAEAHDMKIVFNLQALMNDVKPPVVVQHYHNHDSVLLKVYVIGNKNYLGRRPSLRNLSATETNTIEFGRVSQKGHVHTQAELDLTQTSSHQPVPDPPMELVEALSKSISSVLGITLFGYDLIREAETGLYYIIDINYFPGYHEAPNFASELFEFIKSKLPHTNN